MVTETGTAQQALLCQRSALLAPTLTLIMVTRLSVFPAPLESTAGLAQQASTASQITSQRPVTTVSFRLMMVQAHTLMTLATRMLDLSVVKETIHQSQCTAAMT